MAITGSMSGSAHLYGMYAGWQPASNGARPSINFDTPSVINVASNYNMGGHTIMLGGVTQSISEGNPAVPCLQMDGKNAYKFRWGLTAGSHTIQCKTKQARNINAFTRPSLFIDTNPGIGLTGSIESFAASGSADWVTIGPITIDITNSGGTWVELRNNSNDYSNNPCYFDTIEAN